MRNLAYIAWKLLPVYFILFTFMAWADTPTPYPQPTVEVTFTNSSGTYVVYAPTPVWFTSSEIIQSNAINVEYDYTFDANPSEALYLFISIPNQLYTNGLRFNGHASGGGSWAVDGKTGTLTAASGLSAAPSNIGFGLMDQTPKGPLTGGHYEMQMYIAPDLTVTPQAWGAPIIFEISATPTPEPTPIVTPTVTGTPIILAWRRITANAGWTTSSAFRLLTFANKIWKIGGLGVAGETNDVWHSTNGADWTLATGNAAWAPRADFCALTFNSKMWVFSGGGDDTRYNDVWSSGDGVDWTLATGNAAFSTRSYANATVYDGKMWIIAGTTLVGGTLVFLNDVWHSTDGIDWTAATRNAEFRTRDVHAVTTYDNTMWVLGGENTTWMPLGTLQDVWYSTNGADWTLATGTANWSRRGYCESVVYLDSMWMFTGFSRTGTQNPTDMWYSTNGYDWYVSVTTTGMGNRAAYGITVFNNKIWMASGAGATYDVWSAAPPSFTRTPFVISSRTHTPTATSTVTRGTLATKTITPTLTITTTHTETRTASPTFTQTQTATPLPTADLTPHYHYNNAAVIFNENVVVATESGSISWAHDFVGAILVGMASLRSGPADAFETTLAIDAQTITVTVYSILGVPVSCTTTSATIGVTLYLRKEEAPWQ